MVGWVGERRWAGWMPAAAEAPPRSRLPAECYSEGRTRWPRENGEARGEADRERKRARQKDPN